MSFVTGARNRTNEFLATIETLKKQSSSTVLSTTRPNSRASTATQFSEAAKAINLGISAIASKLHDLTRIAKATSLFNDQSSQIQELTSRIKQDMNILNGEVEALELWVNNENDTKGQSQAHSQHVVFNLKTQLAQQARSFAHLLTQRTKSLKEQSSRKKQFSTATVLPLRKRPLLDLEYSDTNTASSSSSFGTESAGQQMQYQALLENEVSDDYVQSRVAAVQDIESTIAELATMYQRLAILVKQQEEQAVRLDMNVEETLVATESAYSELQKYYEWVSGNRWLMIKVFAVLIVFAIIFVVFVQ